MFKQNKILRFLTPAVIAAFRQKVGTPVESGCFPWLGAKRADGYGIMRRFGMGIVKAHRIAWVIANGRDIPEGLVIDHLCDSKGCVNPAHLEAISQYENVTRHHKRANPVSVCKQGHEHPRGRPCQLCAKENVRRWKEQNPERWKAISHRYESKRAKTRWQWHKDLPKLERDPEIIS